MSGSQGLPQYSVLNACEPQMPASHSMQEKEFWTSHVSVGRGACCEIKDRRGWQWRSALHGELSILGPCGHHLAWCLFWRLEKRRGEQQVSSFPGPWNLRLIPGSCVAYLGSGTGALLFFCSPTPCCSLSRKGHSLPGGLTTLPAASRW